jgi:hypothetical protein
MLLYNFCLVARTNGTNRVRGRSTGRRYAVADKIVSVGLLTQRDLDVLGTSFTRHFPVPRDDMFADLLDRLDRVDAVPIRNDRTQRH